MKSLFKPSYHSGQLSEMSLFCGQTFVPPTALAATFHWQPSCRPSQWQKPQDFWPSAETSTPCGEMPPVYWTESGVKICEGSEAFELMRNACTCSECV